MGNSNVKVSSYHDQSFDSNDMNFVDQNNNLKQGQNSNQNVSIENSNYQLDR